MVWKELRKFNIDKVVLEINRRLEDLRSLNKVADTLGASESTIRKYVTSKGYKRVGNKFVPKDDICNSIENTHEVEQNTDVLHMYETEENLMYINREIDTLKSVIKWFKDRDYNSNTSVLQETELRISLPCAPIKRTSIRINSRVWEMFDELVKENKQFAKHDIMGMSLLEFINRYKKNEDMDDVGTMDTELGAMDLEDDFNPEDYKDL